MPLAGAGVLAIWNGVADGTDAAFRAWHVREHIPERVGLPGFNAGRRYHAVDGSPAYFNFYEVESVDVLTSPAYLARLNDPTPWTRETVQTFTDTSRTLCHVAQSLGHGIGGYVETLRFDAALTPGLDCAALLERPGVTGVHRLARADAAAPETVEARLRRVGDLSSAAILLVETATEADARSLRTGALSDAALSLAGQPVPAARGLYRFEFALGKGDLSVTAP